MRKKIVVLIILVTITAFSMAGFLLQKKDSQKISVKTKTGEAIKTKDFTQSSNRTLPGGGEEFSPFPEAFNFLYRTETDSFLISIFSSPFDEVRFEAERAFTKSLGISQTEACKLEVSVTTPHFANPEHSGEIFGLSFCE